MPGYLKIHKSNLLKVSYCISVGIVSLLLACKSSEVAERKTKSPNEFKEFLDKYEKTFTPSDFNLNIDSIHNEERKQQETLEETVLINIAPPETIPGFRVQVVFTPDIAQANGLRDSLSVLIPEEWTYIVYDSPYYKVRVGNYIERSEANITIKRLVDLGYKESWIVPDKIIKNPPPRPPDLIIPPEKQPE